MSLLQMSGAAGTLILGIVLFRFLFMYRVPKKVMILLWEIAVWRLLLPFAIPLPLPEFLADAKNLAFAQTYNVTVESFDENEAGLEETGDTVAVIVEKKEPDLSAAARMVYLFGAAFMLSGSLFLYIRDSRLFKEGLPMPEQERKKLISLAAIGDKDLKFLQKIRFQISDRTATPVTYGWIHPAVIFPKGLSLEEEKAVRFCLQHELVHIRNSDNLKKLLMHLALCIHWFNPLVWVMYLLFNRDLELMCDETVVRRSGEPKQEYALALLSMAACRSRGFRTVLGFGKNAVKERIVAVMTFHKTSLAGILAAMIAVPAALTAFVSVREGAYDVITAVYISSESSYDQTSSGWEGTEMAAAVTEDVSGSMEGWEYTEYPEGDSAEAKNILTIK